MAGDDIAELATQGVGLFGMTGMEGLIASLAFLLALGTFFYTFRKEGRIERGAAYLTLELASIEVFKYKAEHFDALHWGETEENLFGKPKLQLEEQADSYFYQCLNLFEAASRFRKIKVIQPEVYASWVAWFYEVLEYAYFRRQWLQTYRDNYTREVREVFDAGVGLDWGHGDDNARRKAFYASVAEILDCDVIEQWRVEVPEKAATGPESAPGTGQGAEQALTRPDAAPGLSFHWNDPADVADAAAFAGKTVGREAAYISHGEIQTGLSLDGRNWVPDLGALYAADFADPGERDMLVGRDAQGQVRAMLILAWERSSRVAYAVIEDMAVDPDMRSGGVGAQLIAQAEKRIAERGGIEWVFLESGLHNEKAHGFFERHGFAPQSKVFAKRLQG